MEQLVHQVGFNLNIALEHVSNELRGKLWLVVKHSHHLFLFNQRRADWRDCGCPFSANPPVVHPLTELVRQLLTIRRENNVMIWMPPEIPRWKQRAGSNFFRDEAADRSSAWIYRRAHRPARKPANERLPSQQLCAIIARTAAETSIPRRPSSVDLYPCRPNRRHFMGTAPQPGRVLGKYRLLEKLGQGGMGVVWRAEDMRLGRQVALKFLTADSAHEPSRRKRFELEARAAAALSHPGIATVYELGEAEGEAFIAFEYVTGVTLRSSVTPGGLPADEL